MPTFAIHAPEASPGGQRFLPMNGPDYRGPRLTSGGISALTSDISLFDRRPLQRLLAMTPAIWHNCQSSHPIRRSLTAYNH